MTSPSREELREAVAREEARVARLEEERRQAQGRLEALRVELAGLDWTSPRVTGGSRYSPIPPGPRPPPGR